MIEVRFNLHAPLARLEAHQDRRYSYAEIAAASGISRQGVRRLLKEPTLQIDVGTLSKLLTFFASQGMPITVSDLFTVTSDGPSPTT